MNVKVGQVWRDNDGRYKGNGPTLTILAIEGERAVCQRASMKTRIKLSRFKPTSSGYVLVKDV